MKSQSAREKELRQQLKEQTEMTKDQVELNKRLTKDLSEASDKLHNATTKDMQVTVTDQGGKISIKLHKCSRGQAISRLKIAVIMLEEQIHNS